MKHWSGAPFGKGTPLTRISVTGSGNVFFVRNGEEEPVRVFRNGVYLECECRRTGCLHVASLRMCGFVEAQGDVAQAA